MWGLFRRQDEVERALRAVRARPGDELVEQIEARVRAERRATGSRRSFRLAVPVMLTTAAAAALAGFGGVSYAATQVESAASAAKNVFSLDSSKHVSIATSGRDQYRSGYGWGAAGHTHTGQPGIGQPGGFVPPPLGKVDGLTAFVASTFTIDEQAHLFISVIDDKGKEILITQNKSRIGNGIHGVQAKNLNYLVLVPRTIPIKLGIPRNLLKPGQHYWIRIIARAPNFEKKTLTIGFTMPTA